MALLVATLLVQMAAWAMADLSARIAANHALNSARVLHGTAADARTDGDSILDQIVGGGLTDRRITVTRDADVTTVTVTGTTLRVIPFARLHVTVTVQAPTEPDTAIVD